MSFGMLCSGVGKRYREVIDSRPAMAVGLLDDAQTGGLSLSCCLVCVLGRLPDRSSLYPFSSR